VLTELEFTIDQVGLANFKSWVCLLLQSSVPHLDLSNLKLTALSICSFLSIWNELLIQNQGLSVQSINFSNNFIGLSRIPKASELSSSNSLSCSNLSGIEKLMLVIMKTNVNSVQLSGNFLTAYHCLKISEILRKYPYRDLLLDLSKNPLYFRCSNNDSSNVLDDKGIQSLKTLLDHKSEARLFAFLISPTVTNITLKGDEISHQTRGVTSAYFAMID
jgi:hypothetical protein